MLLAIRTTAICAPLVALFGIIAPATAAPATAAPAAKGTQVAIALSASAPDCPALADSIEREVTAFSAHIQFVGAATPRAAQVDIAVTRSTAQQGRLLAVLRSDSELRNIEAHNCSALSDAVALILLVAYDPDAPLPDAAARAPFVAPTLAPRAAQPALAATASAKPLAVVVAAAPSVKAPASIVLYTGIETQLLAVPFYDPSLGMALSFGAERARSFDIRAALSVTTTRLFSSTSPAVFDTLMLTAEGCPVSLWPSRMIGVFPCAGAAVGMVQGNGRGAPIPGAALTPWIDARALVRLKARFGNWSLPVAGGAMLPLLRPTFVFDKPRIEVTQVPIIAAFFTIGVERRFP
jgi:hypothetical protein